MLPRGCCVPVPTLTLYVFQFSSFSLSHSVAPLYLTRAFWLSLISLIGSNVIFGDLRLQSFEKIKKEYIFILKTLTFHTTKNTHVWVLFSA